MGMWIKNLDLIIAKTFKDSGILTMLNSNWAINVEKRLWNEKNEKRHLHFLVMMKQKFGIPLFFCGREKTCVAQCTGEPLWVGLCGYQIVRSTNHLNHSACPSCLLLLSKLRLCVNIINTQSTFQLSDLKTCDTTFACFMLFIQ